MAREPLDSLLRAMRGINTLLILPHNDPDPDAIASGVALRYLLAETLGTESRILYKGIVGRAENRALVRYLDYPLRRLRLSELCPPLSVALVDTQPGAGNNALPVKCKLGIVIDHHPWREATSSAAFHDVRADVGATSTVLTEYLRAADLALPPWLATALFYGLKTDTMGLSRGAGKADVDAYFYLQPQVEIDALVGIERAQVPAHYFKSVVATLQSARVYGAVLISYLGPMSYPSLAAEMADLLLRLKGIKWVVCLGAYGQELILSVRTTQRGGAEKLVQQIVASRGTAGGHGTMAGGQVPLKGQDPASLALELERLVLSCLGVSEQAGTPLI